MEKTNRRHQAKMDDIEKGCVDVQQMLMYRLSEKGNGIYVSSHETFGIIKEEFDELSDAVKRNDKRDIERELLDIAVGALFGYISSKTNKQDWP